MSGVAIPIVEEHRLLRAAFAIEEIRNPDGAKAFAVNFDVVKGNVGERYSVIFDEQSFENFLAQCQSVKSGLEVATSLPPIERIH